MKNGGEVFGIGAWGSMAYEMLSICGPLFLSVDKTKDESKTGVSGVFAENACVSKMAFFIAFCQFRVRRQSAKVGRRFQQHDGTYLIMHLQILCFLRVKFKFLVPIFNFSSYLCSPKRHTMKYKAVIFDLDGTLTDTLEDLWRSTNYALASCGLPERTLDEVRRFVGNGVRKLIERAVPKDTSPTVREQCFDAFRAHYMVHCQDHTSLYPGVSTLLMALHAKGYRMAVVSNKVQEGVTELAGSFFHGLIDVAIGERPGIPRKPEPDMVREAMRQLGVLSAETVYVGDSDVDLQTAANAGLPCISVLWGFRSRDFLVAHGATTFAEKPEDVLRLV